MFPNRRPCDHRCVNIAVLIGAGASFGAGGIAPERPPRGNELFDRLQEEFPESWGTLLDADECDAFGGDPPFESGMKMLWDKGGQRVQRLIIDMGIYFCRFRPDGRSNCYAALLRLLMTTRSISVFFCSLNYECVFEQVAEHVGLDLINLGRGHRETGPRACLYKPHGSCNYIDPLTRNMQGGVVMADSPHYIFRERPSLNDIEVVSCTEVEEIYKDGVKAPPVMSLYEPTKHSPVDSRLMDMIREEWARGATGSDVILAIGARPVLDDHHIWNAVINSSAVVWFVGGQEDAYSALEKEIGNRLVHLASTFKSAIPVLQRRLAAIVIRR
jgi:hypothetical protein